MGTREGDDGAPAAVRGPLDTHRLGGRFGRVKPRCRALRGFHRVAGAQHALALLADVWA